MLKRIISLLFSAAFLISGTGLSPVSAENAAAAEAFCYENTFDLGIDSAVDFEDENLSLTVPAKNLMKTAQLDGNNGITYIIPMRGQFSRAYALILKMRYRVEF